MRIFVLMLIALMLFGFLARPLLLNQVPIEYDLGRYHLPLRDFFQKCLQNGDDPHWCPHLFCGYDLHGEGQVGMDHPWHRLLYSFLPLTVAFNIEIFANYPFLFLGTYLFLRRHELPRDAAMAGALTLTFGGYTLPHYAHTNAIAIIAHMPWLLWATDVLWQERRPMAGLAIALFTGSQILLGYPQYVYFSCLAEGLYVLCLIVGERRSASSNYHSDTAANMRFDARLFGIWLSFKSLGVAIGGAQLLPSLQALELSPRPGYDPAFRGMLSLPWEMLLQLLAPTQFNVGTQLHEYTVYGGCLATLGTVWLLTTGSWFGRKTVLDLFAIVLVFVAVPLALGRHTPLFQVYLKLPVVGVFRCPCRYLVLSHFAAAIVVARLTHRLGEARPLAWACLLWLCVVPTLAWACVVVPWDQLVSDECQKFLSTNVNWLGAASLTIATLLLMATNLGKRWALSLLLAIGFADLGYWGFRSIYGTHDIPVHTFVDLAMYHESQLAPPGPPNGRVEIADVHGNGLMMQGWSLTSGYVGLSPTRTLDYGDVESLRRAGTTWRWINNEWITIDGAPRLRAACGIAPTTNRPGNIALTVTLTEPNKLIFTESRHLNWRATIDDVTTTITQADGDFQSIEVPAGTHTIKFHFDPVRRTWGRRVSISALVIALLLSLWLRRQRTSTMTKSAIGGLT